MPNMCLSDRVIDGDVYTWYNPANSLTMDEKATTIENENREDNNAGLPARGHQHMGLTYFDVANIVQNVQLDRQNHLARGQ